MMKWCRAAINGAPTVLPGLERRRKAEAALWLTPIAVSTARGLLDAEETSANVDVASPEPAGIMATKSGSTAAIIGGASGVGLLSSAASSVDQVNDALSSLSGVVYTFTRLLSNAATSRAFVYCALIGLVAGAIWYMRGHDMHSGAR
jgi:hypothetical protein